MQKKGIDPKKKEKRLKQEERERARNDREDEKLRKRKKKIEKEEAREEAKKQRLASLTEKASSSSILSENDTYSSVKEIINGILSTGYESKVDFLDDTTDILKIERNKLQEELKKMENPEIHEIPDFLILPEKSDKRQEVMSKIEELLKYRFSLITIADILECNDYDRLDEIVKRKIDIYNLVKKFESESLEETKEDDKKNVKLFSGFKRVVGEEYSKIYSEQETRMKAVIKNIYCGEYFEASEEPEYMVEDIIAQVIDHPDFNLACQIEAEYVRYELDRAISVLSDLKSRSELESLIDNLNDISKVLEERLHGYQVMDRLINGRVNDREIIKKDEEKDI